MDAERCCRRVNVILIIYRQFQQFFSSFAFSNQIKHSFVTLGEQVHLLDTWTKRKIEKKHKLPAPPPPALCQMTARLSLGREMSYGAHRFMIPLSMPHLSHPREHLGKESGCQGIILMNLDSLPTSAVVVFSQSFIIPHLCFFSNRTGFSCTCILRNRGVLSLDLLPFLGKGVRDTKAWLSLAYYFSLTQGDRFHDLKQPKDKNKHQPTKHHHH